MTSVVVVSAGLSVPSSTRLLADRLAAATANALRDAEITHVELRDLAHELTDNLLTGFPGPRLAAVVEDVRRADALIVVTPVFSASYSGLFKTFFDVLEPGVLDGKPVLVAATAGTARHSLVLEHALRPLSPTCTRSSCRPACSRPPTTSATPVSTPGSRGPPASSPRLVAPGHDTAGAGTRRTVADELSEPTPFEQLLRRATVA